MSLTIKRFSCTSRCEPLHYTMEGALTVNWYRCNL